MDYLQTVRSGLRRAEDDDEESGEQILKIATGGTIFNITYKAKTSTS